MVRKRFYYPLILIGIVVTWFTCVTASAADTEKKEITEERFQQALCPMASPAKSINLNGRILAPARSPEQEEAYLETLRSSDGEELNRAVIALALGGNLRAFKNLLESRNLNLLSMFGGFYQNKDATRCVDPFIESAIVDYVDDPELSEPLLSFFGKNVYRSRKLFELLVTKKIDRKNIRVFGRTIRALVATNLPEIEQQVLEHAIQNMVNSDPEYWWLMPSIDGYYLDFFVKRRYEPVIKYIQDILDEAHYSTVPEKYRNHLINRHQALYRWLDRFPSSPVEAIFLKQLSKLVNLTPDELIFALELEAVGKYALKHALSYECRNRIVNYLSQIMEKEASFDQSGKQKKVTEESAAIMDYKIRSKVIELLTQTVTNKASSVMMREMNRLVNLTETKITNALITQILANLATLPATVEIDIPLLIKAVSKLEDRRHISVPPEVFAKHPHPDGYRYLLTQLGSVVTSGRDFKKMLGIDYKAVFNQLFGLLLTFSEAGYLFDTRIEIDRLFEKGKLDERLYISSSKQLNSLIGNESLLYSAFRRKKEAEEVEK